MGAASVSWHFLSSGIFTSFHFSNLIVLSCLFFTFPCCWLGLHVSWAFHIVCGLLFIPTVVYYALTSFTVTGILHKGIDEELENQALTMKDPNNHWCNKCQLYCLPHTFHCFWCKTCVEEFDHHCTWLNNCIGRQNLHFFVFFVVFLSSYEVAVLSSCLVYLSLNSREPFSVEKICTALVTFSTVCYLIPLILLQLSYILGTRHKDKAQTVSTNRPFSSNVYYTAFCKQDKPKSTARSLMPSRGPVRLETTKASEFQPKASVLISTIPAACPRDKSGEQRAAKAWHHILSTMGNLLHRTGPHLGASAEPDATEAVLGQNLKCYRAEHTARPGFFGRLLSRKVGKNTSSQLGANERSVDISIPDMLAYGNTQDVDHNAHWKCQIHNSRRALLLPTATLLSVSDI